MTAQTLKIDRPTEALNDQQAFRHAMRQLASGVSIIAAGGGDERAGMVASSVSSYSVDPPTLLVCIAKTASIAPVLKRYRHFSANILSASQRELADRFAGRTGIKGAERFAAGNWITLITGAPVLANALASVDCEVEEIIERHTHLIVLGRVAAARADDGDALGHWRGGYLHLGDGRAAPR